MVSTVKRLVQFKEKLPTLHWNNGKGPWRARIHPSTNSLEKRKYTAPEKVELQDSLA